MIATEKKPFKVLVVDDSPTARLLISDALQARARRREEVVRVTEAADGFEALRQIPRGTFDVVLTDINMPTLSGLELIRMIRARPEQRTLPIVAISTERTPDDARRARAAGADAYLGKPFEAETLDRLLDEVLVAARSGDEG